MCVITHCIFVTTHIYSLTVEQLIVVTGTDCVTRHDNDFVTSRKINNVSVNVYLVTLMFWLRGDGIFVLRFPFERFINLGLDVGRFK